MGPILSDTKCHLLFPTNSKFHCVWGDTMWGAETAPIFNVPQIHHKPEVVDSPQLLKKLTEFRFRCHVFGGGV